MIDHLKPSHQQAIIDRTITDRDNRIQAIQYGKVGLQGEIRNARQTVTDMIENR